MSVKTKARMSRMAVLPSMRKKSSSVAYLLDAEMMVGGHPSMVVWTWNSLVIDSSLRLASLTSLESFFICSRAAANGA